MLMLAFMATSAVADESSRQPAKKPEVSCPGGRWCTDFKDCRPFGTSRMCKTYCEIDKSSGLECNANLAGACPAQCNFKASEVPKK
jgi:hypothetical protein